MANKSKVATLELRKLIREYFLQTGLLVSALNATLIALGSLQTGIIDLKQFLVGEFFIGAFMVVNGLVFWAKQYQKA